MEPMIFDSHAHYDSSAFDTDREALLLSMQENRVGTVITVGATLDSLHTAVELAARYPHVYAAVGIHPDEVGGLNEETFAFEREQCKKEKVVAVGEIGLDYYWDKESHEIQKQWFIRQLDLARQLDLPVMIHSREAAADTMEIMQEHAQGLKGVIHCFSYSPEQALMYIRMGFYIGVGGVVTFKNGRKLKEVVGQIPLDKILLETDAPYLAPEPYRGKRNSSIYLSYVAEEIARIKDTTKEEVIRVTRENARKLFGI